MTAEDEKLTPVKTPTSAFCLISRFNRQTAKRYRPNNIGSCIGRAVFRCERVHMSPRSYISIFRLERDGIVLLGTGRFDTLLRVENLSSVAEDSKAYLRNASDPSNPHGCNQIYPIRLSIRRDPQRDGG